MELGVCVASHIGDIDYIVRAEQLGYTHAWLADSHMIRSDCYATLAQRLRPSNDLVIRGCENIARNPSRSAGRNRQDDMGLGYAEVLRRFLRTTATAAESKS